MTMSNLKPDPDSNRTAHGSHGPRLYRPSELPEPPLHDPNVVMGVDTGLLRKGGSLLITGPTGSGKSTGAGHLAIDLGLGRPFLKIPVAGDQRVLLATAAGEDGPEILWAQIQGLYAGLQLTDEEKRSLEDNLMLLPLEQHGSRALDELARVIDATTPDVVILNPLQHFCDGHPSEPNACTQFVGRLKDLMMGRKVAVVIIHHTPKRGDEHERGQGWAQRHYAGLGAGALFDHVRSGVCLQARGKRGQLLFKLAKGAERAGLGCDEFPIEWINGETVCPGRRTIKHLGWALSAEIPEAREDDSLAAVTAVLQEAGTAFSQSDILDRWPADSPKPPYSTLGKALQGWMEAGMISGERQGKRWMYSLPAGPESQGEAVA